MRCWIILAVVVTLIAAAIILWFYRPDIFIRMGLKRKAALVAKSRLLPKLKPKSKSRKNRETKKSDEGEGSSWKNILGFLTVLGCGVAAYLWKSRLNTGTPTQRACTFVRRNFLPILIGSVLVGIFTYQQGYFAKLKSKLNICGKGKSKVDSSSDDSDDVRTRSEKKGKRNKKRGSGGGRPRGGAEGNREAA